jgi:acyl carrier protein
MSVATGLAAEENPANDGLGERVAGLVHEILARRSVSRAILLDDELRQVGLNSLDIVNLMLSVESEFDLKIMDVDMTLRNFQSISTISALVRSMLQVR